MNIVDFWKQSNTCKDAECAGCLRMERTLSLFAEMLPTLEAIDAAMQVDDDAAATAVLDAIHDACRTCLSAAAMMALYATSNKHRIVNGHLAGHLFTLSLAKAVKAVGLPIPVAVTQPAGPEIQAAVNEALVKAGIVPDVPIKH